MATPTMADAAKKLWRVCYVSVSTRSDRLRDRIASASIVLFVMSSPRY